MKRSWYSLCAVLLFSACAHRVFVVAQDGSPVADAFVVGKVQWGFQRDKTITQTDSNGLAYVERRNALTVGGPGFLPNSCLRQGLVTTCQLARIPAGPPPYQYVPGVDDVFFVLYAGTNALARKPSPLWQSYDAYLLDLYKRGYYQRSEDLGYLTPDSPYGR